MPVNDQYVSGSVVKHNDVKSEGVIVEMKSLKSIIRLLKHNRIDILKMDVEGSEFKIISQLDGDECKIINQICMEIHERFFSRPIVQLWKLLRDMKKRNFVLVNIGKELDVVTFIRRYKQS